MSLFRSGTREQVSSSMSDFGSNRPLFPRSTFAVMAGAGIVLAVGLGIIAAWRHFPEMAAQPHAATPIMPDLSPLLSEPRSIAARTPEVIYQRENDKPAEVPPSPVPQSAAPPAKPKAAAVAQPRPRPVRVKPKQAAKPKPVFVAKALSKPAPHKLVAPPAAGKRWVVQLGAFTSEDHAKLLVQGLAAHGRIAHIVRGQNKTGQPVFLVQTPEFTTSSAAKAEAGALARHEHMPSYIIERPTGPS
jgi:cell division septation protein DedD